MRLLDGKALSRQLQQELKRQVQGEFLDKGLRVPSLATVLVGAKEDSRRYVQAKHTACKSVGVDASRSVELPASIGQTKLEEVIRELSRDERVDGVLVQLPLPEHLDQDAALLQIDADKDVDGFHPLNVGLLCKFGETARSKRGGVGVQPLPRAPCTPAGILALLDAFHVPIAGKRAVVLGRSNIVGLPTALMLTHRDATTTIVHSKTVDPRSIVREADIVICAMGRPNAITADWIKPGAAVVDVGINSVNGKLVGDVDFADVSAVAGFLSPVPGGVGPMTVTMLLSNTVRNALARRRA